MTVVLIVLSILLCGFAAGLVVGVAYGVGRESERRDDLARAAECRRRIGWDESWNAEWGRR